ncbi:hypothetical protein K469DRAFT_696945 [Zopfia rhizophila CBS 207.26]|uniref:Gamma-glutamylcyclotransferase AIG2-like domain-containing protein n=1 Tax=Zopfia rhizophila CBS 207.26 TaxID=1314779 RepID=A0A6A6EJN6_9PEZI|nr:hypothetical protein K469DRAFT_696945 [Zopfia rhizophila CBS 207.26]
MPTAMDELRRFPPIAIPRKPTTGDLRSKASQSSILNIPSVTDMEPSSAAFRPKLPLFQHRFGCIQFKLAHPWRQALDSQYSVPYFFYGSLTDPKTLKRVLGSEKEPRIGKARVVGSGKVKCVSYWTLVGKDEGSVEGVIFHVESAGRECRLTTYDTQAYRPSLNQDRGCAYRFPLENVGGRIFVYAGDSEKHVGMVRDMVTKLGLG